MDFEVFPIDDPRWARLVQSDPRAGAFHLPAWAKLLSVCYGYRTFVVGAADGTDCLRVGIPAVDVRSWITGHRWVSLPFSDYCFPLSVDEGLLAELRQALDAVRTREKASRFEVRWPVSTSPGDEACPRVLHTLALDGSADRVFSTFSRKTRQYVRKAEKEGLQLLPPGVADDDDTFYALHLKTHVKLGAPVQPRKFFHLLWDRVVRQGNGHVLVIGTPDGQPVSSALVLHHNRNAMIKYSASNPDFLNQRCHYLLFAKAIEWACQNEMKQIDFGRTEASSAGLRQFKNGWGAREEPLTYSALGGPATVADAGRFATLLQPIIRRSPHWVSRMIGEAFYRHGA